jgi:phage tail sheath protein FI
MAEKIVSPGVFTKEIDQSFLPAAIGEIGGVVIGPTVKGPAETPTIVSSYSEFQEKFGDTFKSGSNYYQFLTSYTARNYLKHSPRMTVVRTLNTGYSHATSEVSNSTTAVGSGLSKGSIAFTAAPSVTSSAFVKIHNTKFHFVVSASKYEQSSTQCFIELTPDGALVGGPLIHQLGDTPSDQLGGDYETSASIYVTNVDAATIATRFSDFLNASQSIHGLNITSSTVYSHGTDNLYSGSQVNITASIASADYDYTITTGSVDDDYTAFAGKKSMYFGTPVSMAGGTGASGGVSFKLHTLSHGEILNNNYGLGNNNKLVSGSKDNVQWEIPSVNNKKGTFTLLVRAGNDTIKRKQILETWNNVSLDPNSKNYISKIIGDTTTTMRGSGTDVYLQDSGSYSNKSKYVRVEVISPTVDYLDENGEIRNSALSESLPQLLSTQTAASGTFNGGSDGTFIHGKGQDPKDISETNSQGFNLTTAAGGKTTYENALNLLNNQDQYDVNLFMLPGVVSRLHTAVAQKAIDVVEGRGDAFLILDPTEHAAAITTATTEAETRDSNYAGMYWPWIQMPDLELGKTVWVPPSVALPGIYAFNDKVAHEWFAPAGLNRGGIDTAIQAERKLTQANRDTLYESNVNPIATFPGQGVTVFGQKTLQKKASALDRINVRRLLIRLKKFIASTSRFLVFEQNNSKTRNRFLGIVNPFLEQVQSNSGLTAFKVVMDDTNNTPDVVDRNILYGQIFVQPTRTAEFIVLDFTVQPTGATFPE